MTWKDFIIALNGRGATQNAMDDIECRLHTNNAIVFFDHHYAFDAVPLGLAIGKYIKTMRGMLIPYAVHLVMGVGREGEFSLRYIFRTLSFKWLVRILTRNNPEITFLPTVRGFEMDTPRLREIVDRDYRSVNTRYLRTFVRLFSKNDCGQLCFLTPISGIAFPGKPVLHPQLYRSVNLAQAASKNEISFYFAGAYPSWQAYRQYWAPLMSRHTIAIRGPFCLPVGDYEGATICLKNELEALRRETGFRPPDYERILRK
jgi:hypothetical protein